MNILNIYRFFSSFGMLVSNLHNALPKTKKKKMKKKKEERKRGEERRRHETGGEKKEEMQG